METLRTSMIIIAVIVTVTMMTLTYLTLQNNIEKQSQEEKIQARVHVITDRFNDSFKYVKIGDLSPNSSMSFVYPYSGNGIIDEGLDKHWELVRLPEDLGGGKNDISSFRSYSMFDIHIGCAVIYRPQYEKLIDGCHDDTFEPVNGIAIAGDAIFNKYNALPNLDLGVDDQGYIYVKQPTFEFDKNGVIGAGRDVFHCTDPQEENQNNTSHFTTRDRIKSILLSDTKIQKIVYGNRCEFMADGILYTDNGTYRTINVNLNNTEDLSATINLQSWQVISYKLGNLTSAYTLK